MKTDVRTLIIVNMHGYFRARLERSARGRLIASDLRPNDIVGLADGQPLGEFAGVIGIELPAGFFLVDPPDLHLDPEERVPIRAPDRSKDHGIRLRLFSVPSAGDHMGK